MSERAGGWAGVSIVGAVGVLVPLAGMAYELKAMPMAGRGSELLLSLGALGGAAVLCFRGLGSTGGLPRLLGVPAWGWAVALLGWLVLAWLLWSPLPGQGQILMAERGAALLLALGIACSCGDSSGAVAGAVAGAEGVRRGVAAMGWLGTCLLLLAAAGPIPVLAGQRLDVLLKLGYSAPFGLDNFIVGAAVPLLAGHLAGRGWPRWLGVALGVLAASVLASGWLSGDPARGAWVGLTVGLVGWGILRMASAQYHGPVMLVVFVAALLLLGFVTFNPPAGLPASSVQRLGLWQQALSAGISEAPLHGFGPGAALDVLNRGDGGEVSFFAVPSFAEHSHNEALQILVEGGLVGVALAALALLAGLMPLWRRRHEPACLALVVAWGMALALASIESHLLQPGPLVLFAVLAGLTWACATSDSTFPTRTNTKWRLGLGVPAALVAMAVCVGLGLNISASHGGGGPAAIREGYGMRDINRAQDPGQRLALVEALMADLGPLNELELARAKGLLAQERYEEAEAAIRRQIDRLPSHPGIIRVLGVLHRKYLDERNGLAAQSINDLAEICQEAQRRIVESATLSRLENPALQALRH